MASSSKSEPRAYKPMELIDLKAEIQSIGKDSASDNHAA